MKNEHKFANNTMAWNVQLTARELQVLRLTWENPGILSRIEKRQDKTNTFTCQTKRGVGGGLPLLRGKSGDFSFSIFYFRTDFGYMDLVIFILEIFFSIVIYSPTSKLCTKAVVSRRFILPLGFLLLNIQYMAINRKINKH